MIAAWLLLTCHFCSVLPMQTERACVEAASTMSVLYEGENVLCISSQDGTIMVFRNGVLLPTPDSDVAEAPK